MLSKFICLYVAVVFVCGAPPTNVVPLEKQPSVIAIVAQSEELESNGTFKFSYETANGIKREETSYDKVLPKGKSSVSSNEAGEDKDDESNEIHVQKGSYSYTAPDGSVVSVSYIADENGFRPIGDHLPKAPALQEAASSRASKNNAVDNAEGGSEPAAAIVDAPAKDSSKPDTKNKADSVEKESKVADQLLEHVPTAKSENSFSIPVKPFTNLGTSTAQEVSSTTTEIPSTTREKSTTTQEESSTTTEITSTTTDQSSTTEAESSTTTELPTTTPENSSTAQEESSTTTEIPSTTAEVSSTTEVASTELASAATSDVTAAEVTSTEAASTTEQISSRATSSEETSTPAASNNDALPDTTPNTERTTDASTPV